MEFINFQEFNIRIIIVKRKPIFSKFKFPHVTYSCQGDLSTCSDLITSRYAIEDCLLISVEVEFFGVFLSGLRSSNAKKLHVSPYDTLCIYLFFFDCIVDCTTKLKVK